MYFTTGYGVDQFKFNSKGSDKINYLFQLIENKYVDTISIDSIVEEAVPEILSKLDPHSAYIPARDAQAANEDLKGSFSGIGISFRMEKDTVTVMSVIHGGPAEKVGILAGDRIVTANGQDLCKMESTNVMKHLKGERDSEVKLEVIRHGHKEKLIFVVIRGDIPIESIDATYMMDNNIGYIRVKSFGDQTYTEMLYALANLHVRGMNSLIVDLRGNRGGYMHTAIQMVNEFLPKDRLIVYTEGRSVER
jgi:carboxyl-terminal processing protease